MSEQSVGEQVLAGARLMVTVLDGRNLRPEARDDELAGIVAALIGPTDAPLPPAEVARRIECLAALAAMAEALTMGMSVVHQARLMIAAAQRAARSELN